MTLPSSGQLSYSDINIELGNEFDSQASMYSMATTAGKSTSDVGVDDWYGYTYEEISLNHSSDNVGEGDIVSNTLTTTGSWTSSISDPGNVINSISPSSGSVSGDTAVYVEIKNPGPIDSDTATVTYSLTGTSLTVVWTINYYSP